MFRKFHDEGRSPVFYQKIKLPFQVQRSLVSVKLVQAPHETDVTQHFQVFKVVMKSVHLTNLKSCEVSQVFVTRSPPGVHHPAAPHYAAPPNQPRGFPPVDPRMYAGHQAPRGYHHAVPAADGNHNTRYARDDDDESRIARRLRRNQRRANRTSLHENENHQQSHIRGMSMVDNAAISYDSETSFDSML
jgi:hypothetical protein